jgi:HEPN domain-containing protein
MLPDEARAADTAAWLSKARLDVRSAEHALTASPPLMEDATFHSQQAIEKAMKGFLTWHDVPFRKTHSLEELGQQCIELEATLERLVDEAAPLTEYAWKFRYPGEYEAPTRDEAENALKIAGAVVDGLVQHLPSHVRR